MAEKIKKCLKWIWPVALFAFIFFVIFNDAGAKSYLGGEWDRFLGDLPFFGEEVQEESGEVLAESFIRNAVDIAKFVVGAVAVLFGILYAMALVFAHGREEVITRQKQNFMGVFIGFVLLMVASTIADIFNPEAATSEELINFGASQDLLRNATDYIKWLFGSVAVLLMTISGVRMITASGNEEIIDKEKKHLTWGMIGLLIILLAGNIVNAIYVVEGSEVVAAEAVTATQEIAGVIHLILVFLGPIAVLFTIYAGFLYLTALDNEERAAKAKRLIVAGVTGIIIIYTSFALVSTVISNL